MDIELPLQALQNRVNTLEKVVQFIAVTLGEPGLRQINSDRGFRYKKPDIRHFCVLKAVRVVSALNASIVLAREGYTQEIAVLMRTLAEFTTHIEFVLDTDDSEEHRSKVNQYLEAFFADSRRDPEAEIKKSASTPRSGACRLGQDVRQSRRRRWLDRRPRAGREPVFQDLPDLLQLCSWKLS